MSLFKKEKDLLSKEEQQEVVAAIQQAERQTSGEIRVFMERHCKYVQAIERAAEIFFRLKMDKTELRNGVIVYIAFDDKQSAILGDEGIYAKTGGPAFWKETLEEMNLHFKENSIASGIARAVGQIGSALSHYFPYNPETDKNELPDDIIFGK